MSTSSASTDSIPTAVSKPVDGDQIIDEQGSYAHLAEHAFDSSVKRMTSVYMRDGERVAFMKGAVERILAACVAISSSSDSASPLTDVSRAAVLKQMETLAGQGLRVLGFAVRSEVGDDVNLEKREDVESGFTFLGLAGIYDPPRPETKGAVRACRDAGIVVHMCKHPSLLFDVDSTGPDGAWIL